MEIHTVLRAVKSSTDVSRILMLRLIIWPNFDILLADRKADKAKKSGRFGKCLGMGLSVMT